MIEFEKENVIKDWLGSGAINLFGRPSAGKDSQAQRLAERFDGVYISSGDIFRNDVTLSADERAFMEQGGIVSSDAFFDKVLPVFNNPDFAGKPLLLSSIGRKNGEQQSVTKALNDTRHPLHAVIYLVFSEQAALDRLDRMERNGRADDDPKSRPVRMAAFQEETVPVISYYREQGLVIEVDASLSKDEVERSILENLARRADTQV